jgi:hypothetical protein
MLFTSLLGYPSTLPLLSAMKEISVVHGLIIYLDHVKVFDHAKIWI